jgi:hypothetical protein
MTRMISRRDVLGQLTRGGGASVLARALPVGVGAAVLGWPRKAFASVVFVPGDISNFRVIGNQQPVVGATVIFNDASQTDVSGLSADDPDAATGIDLDLTAKFQVTPQGPDGVMSAFRSPSAMGPRIGRRSRPASSSTAFRTSGW